MLLESGGDNLTATFSRALVDVQIFVIDVAGGDKVPRKGGPGITTSDLLVINKTDLAPLVGADLEVMRRDAAGQARRAADGVRLLASGPLGDGCSGLARTRTGASAGPLVSAAVVAELVGHRTRCTTLRSAPPISLRETPEGLFLVASGAGPVGGDDLRLEVDVRCGASLTVRSAAAAMALPGPSGQPSAVRVRARVRGALRWKPEPTILVAGCDHRATTTIDLAVGATLVWREVVVLGRHDEPTGSLLHRLSVDRAGAPLLRNDLPIGPRWPGADGPAGMDGALVVTSLLVVGLDEPPATEGGDGAVLRLADDAWLMTALSGRSPVAGRSAPQPVPCAT